jgi:hypothetical protein
MSRTLARIFLVAFLGSLVTLIAGGNYFVRSDIPDSMLPDWSRMDELFISACIAGVVSLLNALILWLERENGP